MPAPMPCSGFQSAIDHRVAAVMHETSLPVRKITASRPLRTGRALVLHLLRVLLFVTILLLIRQKHEEYRVRQRHSGSGPPPAEFLRRYFSQDARAAGWDRKQDARLVTDAAGETLGFVVQTSPQCDHIVGYVGPTNALLALDRDYRIMGLEVLASGDTQEHVAAVVSDSRFLDSYRGLSWQQAAWRRDVDAVSGATLTSLAIAESISVRLGSPCPSLRFPEAVRPEELRDYWPRATTITPRSQQPLLWDVYDGQGELLGSVVRTSPTCDGHAGYQGPSDAMLLLDPSQRLVRTVIRASYDNQPYVRYVQEDEYFATLLRGRTLSEVASFDVEAEQYEGVSGATMTSRVVAQSLASAAREANRLVPGPSTIIAARDVGTALVLVAALAMTFTRWRGQARWRLLFQLVLVGYLGFLNGDILSQALLVGWAQSGVPWRLAPGLVLLTVAALLVPIVSRRQMYCHHLCPFGAAQQLLRGRLGRSWKVPRAVQRVLAAIPTLLLALVITTAMLHLPLDLASIEPFNAFLVQVAGTATLVIAAFGLAASLCVPLAYCRYGCPTGTLLEFLRFQGHSDRLTRRDLIAVALLGLALMVDGGDRQEIAGTVEQSVGFMNGNACSDLPARLWPCGRGVARACHMLGAAAPTPRTHCIKQRNSLTHHQLGIAPSWQLPRTHGSFRHARCREALAQIVEPTRR